MRILQIFIYVIGLIVIMGCNTSAGVTKKTDSFNEKYPKKENNSRQCRVIIKRYCQRTTY